MKPRNTASGYIKLHFVPSLYGATPFEVLPKLVADVSSALSYCGYRSKCHQNKPQQKNSRKAQVIVMNVLGALKRLNGITNHLSRLSIILKVVFHSSMLLILI